MEKVKNNKNYIVACLVLGLVLFIIINLSWTSSTNEPLKDNSCVGFNENYSIKDSWKCADTDSNITPDFHKPFVEDISKVSNFIKKPVLTGDLNNHDKAKEHFNYEDKSNSEEDVEIGYKNIQEEKNDENDVCNKGLLATSQTENNEVDKLGSLIIHTDNFDFVQCSLNPYGITGPPETKRERHEGNTSIQEIFYYTYEQEWNLPEYFDVESSEKQFKVKPKIKLEHVLFENNCISLIGDSCERRKSWVEPCTSVFLSIEEIYTIKQPMVKLQLSNIWNTKCCVMDAANNPISEDIIFEYVKNGKDIDLYIQPSYDNPKNNYKGEWIGRNDLKDYTHLNYQWLAQFMNSNLDSNIILDLQHHLKDNLYKTDVRNSIYFFNSYGSIAGQIEYTYNVRNISMEWNDKQNKLIIGYNTKRPGIDNDGIGLGFKIKCLYKAANGDIKTKYISAGDWNYFTESPDSINCSQESYKRLSFHKHLDEPSHDVILVKDTTDSKGNNTVLELNTRDGNTTIAESIINDIYGSNIEEHTIGNALQDGLLSFQLIEIVASDD